MVSLNAFRSASAPAGTLSLFFSREFQEANPVFHAALSDAIFPYFALIPYTLCKILIKLYIIIKFTVENIANAIIVVVTNLCLFILLYNLLVHFLSLISSNPINVSLKFPAI